jgi:hypothetical protein
MPDHPVLPCGYNADPIDGDEVDGSGTNWPIWPVLFDCYIGLVALVITQEMIDIFEQACPDIIFPCPDNEITFPRQPLTITPSPERDVVIAGQSDTLGFPHEDDGVEIRKAG